MTLTGGFVWPGWRGVLRAGVVILLLGAACQSTPRAPTVKLEAIKPVEPTPKAATLRSGLAVEYSNIIANSMTDLEIAGRGEPGKALPHLNWPDTSAPFMTSKLSTELAARIRGFIRFSKPGTYKMKVRANDGVRVFIGGAMVLEDASVHVTRFSDTTSLTIKQAGWYKLFIIYFQKRGTAALQLYWQRPGAAQFEIVPANAFAHPRGG